MIGKKTIINYQHLEPTVVLRQKGSDCINEASRLRGDKVRASDGAIIHSRCRQTYTNAKAISDIKKSSTKL